eukprot:14998931-Ditylum_brightwellii.AAC.1
MPPGNNPIGKHDTSAFYMAISIATMRTAASNHLRKSRILPMTISLLSTLVRFQWKLVMRLK